jgi:lipoic acid synthetase
LVALATEHGFKGVMAGPLVRSSYRAGRLWAQAMRRWGRPVPEHLAHLARRPEPRRVRRPQPLVAAFAERSGAPVS